MRKPSRFLSILLALCMLFSLAPMTALTASAATETLSSLTEGDTVSFADHSWIVLDPNTGYLLMQDYYGSSQPFDSSGSTTFDPSSSTNIAYYLNNTFYNSLPYAYQSSIQNKSWTTGSDIDESSGSVTAKIGLISCSEYNTYKANITNVVFSAGPWWTRTPVSTDNSLAWRIGNDGILGGINATATLVCRPALYLDPGLTILGSGTIADPYVVEVPSPALSTAPTAAAGAANGATAITASPNTSGDTLAVEVSASSIATPNVGDAAPTGTGVTNPYTSGSDLAAAAGDYVSIFELNGSNKVVGFSQIQLTSANINTWSAPALSTTPTAAVGTADGTTAITASSNTSGDTLAVEISASSITTPDTGDAAPTGSGVTNPYTSGSDLAAAAGNYVGVFELNGSGNVVAFCLIKLTSAQIKTLTPVLSTPPTAAAGTANSTTAITAIPNTSGDTLAVVVSKSSIATPNVGDAAPSGSGVTNPYAAGSDLAAAAGDYVGVFELNSSSEVVAFSQIQLAPGDTAVPALSAIPAAAAGTANGTTAITASPNTSGDTLAVEVSTGSIGTPAVGGAAPNGSGVTNPYTSGSDLAAAADNYVGVFELNGSNEVVAFSQIQLEPGDIGGNTSFPLKTLLAGNTVTFAGHSWIVLNPGTGYLLMQNNYSNSQPFDSNFYQTFNPNSSTNIAYYLNNTFYNSLSSAEQDLIQNASWTTGFEGNESSGSVNARIGLISYSEYGTYKSYITSLMLSWWTRTPSHDVDSFDWFINGNFLSAYDSSVSYAVRPAIYLSPDLTIYGSGTSGDPYMVKILVPALTTTPTAASGTANNTTAITAGPNTSGDTLAVEVSKSSIGTPAVGTAAPTGTGVTNPYTSGSDLKAVAGDYVGVFELNGSSVVVAFSQIQLAGSDIYTTPALALSATPTAAAGAADGMTAITASPSTSGDTLAVEVSASSIATPNVGDAAPAGTGVTNPYTSGSDLAAAAGDYVGVFELDTSGNVAAFSQIQLTSAQIKQTPAPALGTTPTAALGTANGTTAITAAPNTSGDTLAVKVSTGSIATPNVGDAAPTGSGVTNPYISGSNLAAVVGDYVGVYELNGSGHVVAFSQLQLSSGDSSLAPLNTLQAGNTVNFAGHPWIVLNPSTGYLLMNETYPGIYAGGQPFDPNNTNVFNPTDTNNIAYYLNNTFYGSLPPADEALIQTRNWTTGNEINESVSSVNCKIGLISYSEFNTYKSHIANLSVFWWTRTPVSGNYTSVANLVWLVSAGGSILYAPDNPTKNPVSLRPALYLDSGISVSGSGTSSDPYTVNVPAPALSTAPTAAAGTVNGTTAITASPNTSGDTLAVEVSASSIATPNAGDAAPAGTDVTNPYTSDSDLAAAAGDYVGIFELNASGKVVAFSQIQLSAGDIATSTQAPALSAAPTATAGTANNTTAITASPNTSGDTLAVVVSPSSIAKPNVGDAAPAGINVTNPYISGSDLAASAGDYVGVFELNASDEVVAFSQILLTIAEIYIPPVVSDTEKAAADTASLTWDAIRGTNTSPDSVTIDLSLPATGVVYGSAITWVSGNTLVISNSGVVTRPAYADGDADVTVTATVNNNGVSVTKDFNLKVLKLGQTTFSVSIGALSGGSIGANLATAAEGTTINLTITPDSGKQLKAGTLKYNDGTLHDITGTSFVMPAADVTVTAQFEDVQPVALTGSITGTVTDGTNPISGAAVSLTVNGTVYSAITATTPAAGVYTISGVPAGTGYTVTATRTGYGDGTATVDVTANTTSSGVNITLTAIPPQPATYTVTFNKNGGDTNANPTTKTAAAGGTVGTLPTAPARSGYTFGGWYTASDGSGTAFTAATAVNADLTVYARWTVISTGDTTGGSTSGGNSGSDGGGTPTVTPSSTQPATTTVATSTGDAAPSVTSTTTTEAKSDSNGKATAAVTESQVTDAVSKAVEAAAKQGTGTEARVEIKVTAPADAKAVEASLPKAAVAEVAGSETKALTVSMPVASITFDRAAIATISKDAVADVRITASKVEATALPEEVKATVGDRPVYNFSVTSGDKSISQFGGTVAVSVPYTPKAGEDTNAIVIYYINAEGKPEMVSNCAYDPATGRISFKTSHFSQYAVGYNKVSFKDIPADAWYDKAIGFIAARGITKGTGSGNYSPEAKLTRGEFLVMMMRAYGIATDTTKADNFADAGSTYYTGYLAAAKRLGISGGVGNNMFAPGKEITRQEMFTLMYNALKVIGQLPGMHGRAVGKADDQPQSSSGKTLSDFKDAGQISSWAKDAMTLMAETGIIGGNAGKLTPTGTATRAEMAQVLYNLLSK